MSEKTAPATEKVVSVPAVTEKKRPEKPDEAAFEAAKEKAKKEHKIAQDKFVCGPPILTNGFTSPSNGTKLSTFQGAD